MQFLVFSSSSFFMQGFNDRKYLFGYGRSFRTFFLNVDVPSQGKLRKLKELQNFNGKLFRHKGRWKRNQHFELLFLMINLRIATSNQLHTCSKINLLLINIFYLVFSSLEIPRWLIQTELYCNLFYSVWKETTKRSSKL